jgi:hypothetical protein
LCSRYIGEIASATVAARADATSRQRRSIDDILWPVT